MLNPFFVPKFRGPGQKGHDYYSIHDKNRDEEIINKYIKAVIKDIRNKAIKGVIEEVYRKRTIDMIDIKELPVGMLIKLAFAGGEILKQESYEAMMRTAFIESGKIVGGKIIPIPILGSFVGEKVAEHLYDNKHLMAETYYENSQNIENKQYEEKVERIASSPSIMVLQDLYKQYKTWEENIPTASLSAVGYVAGIESERQKLQAEATLKSIEYIAAIESESERLKVSAIKESMELTALKKSNIENQKVQLIQSQVDKMADISRPLVQAAQNTIRNTDWSFLLPSIENYPMYNDNLIGYGNYPMPYSTGLNYVPYDGFPAILHKGERIMTASENRAYSNPARTYTSNSVSRGGNVFNITINGVNKSADDIINELVHKMSEAVNIMGEVAFE